MEKFSNEIKVGLTILLATAMAYVGFRSMKDLPILQSDFTYFAVYARAEGLATGRSVYLNGVSIGKIQGIMLFESDSVQVRISIDNKQMIPLNSTAQIVSLDILGTKAIQIIKSNATEKTPNFGYLKGGEENDKMGDLMNTGLGLSDDFGKTLGNLNSVLAEMNRVVKESGGKNIENTLDKFSKTSDLLHTTMAKKKGEIEKTISQLEQITATTGRVTKENEAKINAIIGNLEKATNDMDDIAANVKSLSAELNILIGKINKGEGTLGKLANDPKLYTTLDSTLSNVNGLVGELRKDPKKYMKHLKLVRLF